MEYLVKVGAIIIKENKLLINRNKTSPIFLIPGGKVKQNETNEEALKRELIEELGVQSKLAGEFKTYYSDKALFDNLPLKLITYLVEIEEEPKSIPNSEILENVWLTGEDYKSKRYELAPLFYQIIPDLIKEEYLKF